MNILYIDTTGKELIVLLKQKHRKNSIKDESGYHSIELLSVIDRLLEEQKIDLESIDFFAVNKGPGRFTGTRIGIITALMLSEITGKKLVYLTKEDDIDNIENIVKNRDFSDQAVATYDSKSYFEE